MKTESYLNGVTEVTSLAREVNPEIGFYQEHFIDENFVFLVRLSNGTINKSVEIAQDFEVHPSSITIDRIESIARTFEKYKF